METGQLDEIVVETTMPAFLRVFQFNFDDGHGPRQSVGQGQGTPTGSRRSIITPIAGSQFDNHNTLRKSSFVNKSQTQETDVQHRESLVKKNSIWSFDDFLAVQSELMLQTDLSQEKLAINEQLSDEEDVEEPETLQQGNALTKV